VKRVDIGQVQGSFSEELLFLLGEELKRPLVSISQLSELGGKDILIHTQAQKALNTIDNVLLYKQFSTGQMALNFEPVHVGSAITEVVAMMTPQMRMSGCWSEINIQSSLRPADIDRRLLNGALLAMWQAVVQSMETSTKIVCSAQRIPKGIRLSVMSKGINLDNLLLSATNMSSTQPISSVAGPAADLLAARCMFDLVGSKLTKSSNKGMSGFGVTLRTSKQIRLV